MKGVLANVIESISPILYTENVEATIHFYTKHFDFVCSDYDANIGWASLSNGDVELMLSKPNAHIPFTKLNFTGSFYFKTKDVDALWNAVKISSIFATQLKVLITACVNLPCTITLVNYYNLVGKLNKSICFLII